MGSQPNSGRAPNEAQQIFRIKQQLLTGADAFESEVSCYGVAIGPDSDISRVVISYFDDVSQALATGPGAGTLMSMVEISPERPHVGYLQSRKDARYSPGGSIAQKTTLSAPGRILFRCNEVYDPLWQPAAFAGGDTLVMSTPVLDLVQYLSPPPAALVPQRSDKVIDLQTITITAAQTTWLVVPAFGRQYAEAQFTNRSGANLTYGMSGVIFAGLKNSDDSAFVPPETVLTAAAAVANNASSNKIVKSSSDGAFDAFIFSFLNAGGGNPNFKFRLMMSDVPR